MHLLGLLSSHPSPDSVIPFLSSYQPFCPDWCSELLNILRSFFYKHIKVVWLNPFLLQCSLLCWSYKHLYKYSLISKLLFGFLQSFSHILKGSTSWSPPVISDLPYIFGIFGILGFIKYLLVLASNYLNFLPVFDPIVHFFPKCIPCVRFPWQYPWWFFLIFNWLLIIRACAVTPPSLCVSPCCCCSYTPYP